ncbi:MBL fold metallo-hydrolase [Tomitella cavernea]|uniref:MBL fold metallo-hydrolase n=1 Tax=Tomitella cavernea TaxID=1387982 RepID=UPI0019063402|nr:MBL fold metallo-hydrolase [Tomitella cavernea]
MSDQDTPAGRELSLSPHVTQLRGPRGGKYPAGNPLRVTAGDTTVIIDSTFGTDVSACDLLLLSHYHEDHVVGAGAHRGQVAVHVRDAEAVRSWDEFRAALGVEPGGWEHDMVEEFSWSALPDATAFGDGAVFEVGGGVTIRVVPLPGHTAGHCGFMIEPDGVLYLADVDMSSFGPMYGDAGSSLADTRATLAACAAMEAAVYAPYHHKGPYTDRDDYQAALAAHSAVLDQRERRLLDLVAQGHATADALVGRGVIFRPGPRPVYADAVERTMCADHLAELTRRGVLGV